MSRARFAGHLPDRSGREAAAMIASLRRGSELPAVVGVAIMALVFGAVVGEEPMVALALVGVAVVAALTFLAPVAHLVALIVLTAIVPYGLQNRFGIGGGQGAPGLLLSDLLLLTGLARAAVVLMRQPLDRRRTLAVAVTLAFLAAATAQFAHGLSDGRDLSTAGAELRALLGFGAFVVALPIVADARQRARLLKALPIVGIALGLWGIAQWVLHIPFSVTGDVGVRQGVGLTTAGKGQVQGGLYAFPVAIIMSVAALTLRRELSRLAQAALVAILVLNVSSLLLTYERTFWIATVLGCAFVILRARPGERARALFMTVLAAAAILALLSTVAPGELATARERILSLGQYGRDSSVRYRLTESRVVLEQVDKHPIAGSGLAATVFWGRPYERVPPKSYTYTHNGYLWLVWKLGLAGAVLLLALLLLGLTTRGAPVGGPPWLAMRNGAQGALLALLLASVTFPSFNGQITYVMGMLLAICAVPLARGIPPTGATVSLPAWAPPAVGLDPALSRR